MNSTDKYLQHRKLICDEKSASLWTDLIHKERCKYGLLGFKETESYNDQKGFDSDNELMEVWMIIEESIMNFESEQVKNY